MESIFRSIECIENSEHGEPAIIVCLFKILENFWYLSQNEEHESPSLELRMQRSVWIFLVESIPIHAHHSFFYNLILLNTQILVSFTVLAYEATNLISLTNKSIFDLNLVQVFNIDS